MKNFDFLKENYQFHTAQTFQNGCPAVSKYRIINLFHKSTSISTLMLLVKQVLHIFYNSMIIHKIW